MPVDLSEIGLTGQQAFATRMQTLAQADTMAANAEAQQLKNMQEKQLLALNAEATAKMNAILTQAPGVDGPDPSDIAQHMTSLADPFEAVGEVYLKGGATEAGLELLKTAADVRGKESTISAQQSQIQVNKLQNLLKGSQYVGTEIGNAQNESEYKLALANIRKAVNDGSFVMPPALLDQLESTPYSPDVVNYFRDKAISIADQARIQIQQHNSDRSDENIQDQMRTRATNLAISQARLQETNRHNTVMEKVAGSRGTQTGAAAPDSNQLKVVYNNLKTTVFKGTEIDDKDPSFLAAADYVASSAQSMIRANRGLTWETAVNRATIQAKQAGAFETVPGKKSMWPWADDAPAKTSFDSSKPGLRPENAAPPPVDGKGKIVPAKLVKGRYYQLPDGRVGQFTGTGIIPVQQ